MLRLVFILIFFCLVPLILKLTNNLSSSLQLLHSSDAQEPLTFVSGAGDVVGNPLFQVGSCAQYPRFQPLLDCPQADQTDVD
jgi:hypothetical protein